MIYINILPINHMVTSIRLNYSLKYNGKFSHLIGFNSTLEKRHLDEKLNKYRSPSIWYNRKNKYNKVIKKWKVNDQCI